MAFKTISDPVGRCGRGPRTEVGIARRRNGEVVITFPETNGKLIKVKKGSRVDIQIDETARRGRLKLTNGDNRRGHLVMQAKDSSSLYVRISGRLAKCEIPIAGYVPMCDVKSHTASGWLEFALPAMEA